jgi:hypothetical protein
MAVEIRYTGPGHVRFVVDKVARGQVSSKYFSFPANPDSSNSTFINHIIDTVVMILRALNKKKCTLRDQSEHTSCLFKHRDNFTFTVPQDWALSMLYYIGIRWSKVM